MNIYVNVKETLWAELYGEGTNGAKKVYSLAYHRMRGNVGFLGTA